MLGGFEISWFQWDCELHVTSEIWKPLSDIVECATFFLSVFCNKRLCWSTWLINSFTDVPRKHVKSVFTPVVCFLNDDKDLSLYIFKKSKIKEVWSGGEKFWESRQAAATFYTKVLLLYSCILNSIIVSSHIMHTRIFMCPLLCLSFPVFLLHSCIMIFMFMQVNSTHTGKPTHNFWHAHSNVHVRKHLSLYLPELIDHYLTLTHSLRSVPGF